MKSLAFCLIFVPMFAFAQSTPAPHTPTRDELLQTVKHISQLAQETQQELDQEKEAHSQVNTQLSQSQTALAAANKSLVDYEAAVQTITDQANKAIASEAHLAKKLHLAKWILCALAVAAIGLVTMKFMGTPGIGQYALIGGGALSVAACTAIWIWI